MRKPLKNKHISVNIRCATSKIVITLVHKSKKMVAVHMAYIDNPESCIHSA